MHIYIYIHIIFSHVYTYIYYIYLATITFILFGITRQYQVTLCSFTLYGRGVRTCSECSNTRNIFHVFEHVSSVRTKEHGPFLRERWRSCRASTSSIYFFCSNTQNLSERPDHVLMYGHSEHVRTTCPAIYECQVRKQINI